MTWRLISRETLAACRVAADERDRIAGIVYPNDRNFTTDRHLLGFIGEALVAAEAGLVYDPADKPIYDGGCDFPQTDVKATVPRGRFLMRLVAQPLRADFYVLVIVDVSRRRAAVAGYATRREVEAAPVHEFGFGATRCIPMTELTAGIPPPLRS